MMGMESRYIMAALGLVAAIIAAVLGAYIILQGWPLIVAAIIFIIFAIIVVVLILGVLMVVAALPMYFLKRGNVEEGSYRLEEVKPVREDEGK